MKGQRPRKRDDINAAGVREMDQVKQLERKLLSGSLLTPEGRRATLVGGPAAAKHAYDDIPRVTLFDAATAYLQDHGLAESNPETDIPVQRDFLASVAEVATSLQASRDMYRSVPALIAQKQAQLREAVERAMQRMPVGDLDTTIDHFSFEDYQEFLRSIGSLDDEPNFQVFAEGNLQPILAVLRDEAIGMSTGARKVVRSINGFQVVEDVFDGTDDRFQDFEIVHRISTRTKETQTELRVNDKSFLAEITRLSSEIAEYQRITKSQEARLNQWDMFRDTVVKRMTGLLEEARNMQQAKEEELGRVVTLLVHAVRQNEDFANKLSILSGQHVGGGGDGSVLTADGGGASPAIFLSDLDLANERRKIAQSFATALNRAKRQRFHLESRMEAAERQSMTQYENWAATVSTLQNNLNLLHRGFIEGRVKSAMLNCIEEIESLSYGPRGGRELVLVLDELEERLPADARRVCADMVKACFSEMDEITLFSARTAVDLVQQGHKQSVLAEGISKASQCIPNTRKALSSCLMAIIETLGRELHAAHVRLDEQRRAQDIAHEQQLMALRKEMETDLKASALHKTLKKAKDNAPATLDCGTQVCESVIEAAMQLVAVAAKGDKSKAGKAFNAAKKSGKAAETAAAAPNSAATSSLATSPASAVSDFSGSPQPPGPPPTAQHPSKFRLDEIRTTTEAMAIASAFIDELEEEARRFSGHFGQPAPTRVLELPLLRGLMKQLIAAAPNSAKSGDAPARSPPRGDSKKAEPKGQGGAVAGAEEDVGPGRIRRAAGGKKGGESSIKTKKAAEEPQPQQLPATPKMKTTSVLAKIAAAKEQAATPPVALASCASPPAAQTAGSVVETNPGGTASDAALPPPPLLDVTSGSREEVFAFVGGRHPLAAAAAVDTPVSNRASHRRSVVTLSPAAFSAEDKQYTATGHGPNTNMAVRGSSLPSSRRSSLFGQTDTAEQLQVATLAAVLKQAGVDLQAMPASEIVRRLQHPASAARDHVEARDVAEKGESSSAAEMVMTASLVAAKQDLLVAEARIQQEAGLRAAAEAAVERAVRETNAAHEHAAALASQLATAISSLSELRKLQALRMGAASPSADLSIRSAADVLDPRAVMAHLAKAHASRRIEGTRGIVVASRPLAPSVAAASSPSVAIAHDGFREPLLGSDDPSPPNARAQHAVEWGTRLPLVKSATPAPSGAPNDSLLEDLRVERLLGRGTPPPEKQRQMPHTPLELKQRRFAVGSPETAVRSFPLRTPSKAPLSSGGARGLETPPARW